MNTTRLLTGFCILAFTAAAPAAIITQWTFEGDVLTPSTGSGTAANVGGTSSAFATGNGGGRGWNTASYPAQSTASGTAGVRFDVSTELYKDIIISFDQRASGTASRWAQLDYTTDGGTTWTTFGNNGGGLSPHDTFANYTFDLSGIPAVNNESGFGFRIVSIFSPVDFADGLSSSFLANSAYHRARETGGSAYGSAGTWRFDNVTVSGTLIPEPHEYAAMGALGLLGFAAWRRSRKA